MKKNSNMQFTPDAHNVQAIEWLEELGSVLPTDKQITLMETLLRVLGLLLHCSVTLSEFKHLANPKTIKLLAAIEKKGDIHLADEQEIH